MAIVCIRAYQSIFASTTMSASINHQGINPALYGIEEVLKKKGKYNFRALSKKPEKPQILSINWGAP